MRLWAMAALLVAAVACDDTEFNTGGGGGGGDYEASADGMVALMHDHCNECHPALQPAFDTANLLDDVDSGAGKYVVAGDRDASMLWQRLTSEERPMPPTGLLGADVVEPIGIWIDADAPLFGEQGGAE